MARQHWFAIRRPLSPRRQAVAVLFSFLLPLGLWCAVSYLPFLWHPQVKITDRGELLGYKVGDYVEKRAFQKANAQAESFGSRPAKGDPSNPIYLPPPHEVFDAFHSAFTTAPRRKEDPWLHESLWHSLQIIFWGFFLSSLIAVPLGILCGSYAIFSKLFEPFIEFFRYLPAPAFGALMVAILGINDAPKISIIFIGTFFQQVLVISNTTRTLDVSLLEAAQTLGARGPSLFFKVTIPGILPRLFKDIRILLGWAWTYLIIAEVVGTKSGISAYIVQQSKYRIYDNVFAAIIMIGIIGLATDLILAWLGRHFFPWESPQRTTLITRLLKLFRRPAQAKDGEPVAMSANQ